MKRGDLKATLRANGWSLRRASAQVGRTTTHVFEVLEGRRRSDKLLADLARLGTSPVDYRETGFAVATLPRRGGRRS